MRHRYRGTETTLLVLAFAVVLAGVVMLMFTGPQGLGWVLVPMGMLFSLVVSHRAKKRMDAQARKLPSWSQELHYPDHP